MFARRMWVKWLGVPAALAVVTAIGGCATWAIRSPSLAAVLERESPRRVRLGTVHRGLDDVYYPRIVGDSVVAVFPQGLFDTSAVFANPGSVWRFCVPVRDVCRVEVRSLDAGKTALVAFVGVTVLVAVIEAATQSPPPPRPPVNPDAWTDETFSCPVVSSWDGHAWRIDSGTFGGAIAPAFARTDVDNLDFAVEERGVVRLKVEDLLDETEHVDALRLLVVEHDPEVSVAPDPAGGLHTLGALAAPVTARDFAGVDQLDRVERDDGWGWESLPAVRDTADPAALSDGLILEFERPGGARTAKLVVDACNTPWASALMGRFVAAHGSGAAAWYARLSADPVFARAQGAALAREACLGAQVWAGGAWRQQGLFWEAGPEAFKRQVLALDLSGVEGRTVRVRLESAPDFWLVDRVAMDVSEDRPVVARERAPSRAVDLGGRDVSGELAAQDGREYVMERGDAAELAYAVGECPAGRGRTFLIRSAGWYRIHEDERAAPQTALLRRLGSGPPALRREAAARMNAALCGEGW